MSNELFVGVDIGTSGVRAIAIDAAGTVRGQAATPMPTPEREGVTIFQDPEIWWQAVGKTLSALIPGPWIASDS